MCRLQAIGGTMRLPPDKVCRLIRKLYASTSSPFEHEAEVAKEKLRVLLFEHSLTEADIPAILAATDDHGQKLSSASFPSAGAGPTINVFDLNSALIDDHVTVTVRERTAISLWITHTYLFRRFRITSRLAILSPVEECGKSTLLDLLNLTCALPCCSDDPSPASIYHERDNNPDATFLVDEGDNLGLFKDERMRRLFNAGHKQGGSAVRIIDGRPRKFSLFGPLAIAAIGDLPRPLTSRSIIIGMQRQPPGSQKRPIDVNDMAWIAGQTQNYAFAEAVKSGAITLNPNPEMPKELSNRAADNWRVLISIGDALGHRAEARAAAIALSARRSQDIKVVLLMDTREVFDQRGIDRIWGCDLVEAVIEHDDEWEEFCGVKGDGGPHKLRQGELGAMLRAFGIRPRSVWPAHRDPKTSSRKGYLREQFEKVWGAYCPAAGTTAQSNKVKYLDRHNDGT